MSEQRPIFVPTDAGMNAVVRAARLRRWRQAGAALSVTAVIAGTTVGLAVHPKEPGTDRVSVTDDDQDATHSPTPASHERNRSSATAAPGRHGGASAPGTPPPAVTVSPPAAGEGRVDRLPTPAAPPPSQGSAAAPTSPITRTDGTISSTDLCNDGYSNPGSGWCLRYTGATSGRRGHGMRIGAELCRLSAYDAATIRFSSTREIGLFVGRYRTDGTLQRYWQGGEGIHYTSPGPALTLTGGQCFVWSSTWDTRDDDGFVVPPGSYDVEFQIDSATMFSGNDQITVRD